MGVQAVLIAKRIVADIVSREYGSASPANMLEAVAADLSAAGISEKRLQALNHNQIWVIKQYINCQDASYKKRENPDCPYREIVSRQLQFVHSR